MKGALVADNALDSHGAGAHTWAPVAGQLVATLAAGNDSCC